MKTSRIGLVVAGCALAVAAVAAQGSPKQALTAVYAKMDALTLKKDTAGLKKLLTSVVTKDCVFTDEHGKKQTPDVVIAGMVGEINALQSITKSTTHLDSVTTKGGTTVVDVTSILGFKMVEQGKPHVYSLNSKSEDTWVKVGSQWKLKASKEVKQTATKDGQPIS